MPFMPAILFACIGLLLGPGAARAQAPLHAHNLPAEFDAALARARVPRDAVAILLQDADRTSTAAPRISHRAAVPMNPASVMKLVTTYAALDLLGPAFTWTTPVFVEGAIREGTLYGNVYIKGQGDPKLVQERVWLLLRRLQGIGIQTIAGDIVLDRSAFDVPEADPASFDGEPLRPYNVAPDALLINYKAVVMTFTPDRSSNTAQVQFDPPLYGVQTQATVSLSPGECGDYRGALKADFSDPGRIRFNGSYPAACGEKVWPVAYADPRNYGTRAVQGLWLAIGGKLQGVARFGQVPAALAAARPTLEVSSATLAEVVREVNKFSNNVMAQQIFLTLAGTPPARFEASRAVVQQWWRDRISTEDAPVLDNGSGLSRQERISAQGLVRLLQTAYASPSMSELMSSLPITGVDGTLRRSKARAIGSAHLKTGSLYNVIARGGFVDGASGKRYALVAIINHPNANSEASRAAMDMLVEWAVKDN